MNRKERIIATATGLVIGSIIGYSMSSAILRNAEQYKELVEENRMLQQMIMECQENK